MSRASSPASMPIVRKSREAKIQLLNEYNPDRQLEWCGNSERCVLMDCPTLAVVRRDYSEETAKMWLEIQINDFSELTNVQRKLDDRQRAFVAGVLMNEYYWLKLSEVMLFMYWLKMGRYGECYGCVDAVRILSALRTFVKERSSIIEHYEAHKDDNSPETLARLQAIQEAYERMKERGQKDGKV